MLLKCLWSSLLPATEKALDRGRSSYCNASRCRSQSTVMSHGPYGPSDPVGAQHSLLCQMLTNPRHSQVHPGTDRSPGMWPSKAGHLTPHQSLLLQEEAEALTPLDRERLTYWVVSVPTCTHPSSLGRPKHDDPEFKTCLSCTVSLAPARTTG